MLRQVCGDTLQNMWRYLAIYLHILWQVSLLSSITVFLWSHAGALFEEAYEMLQIFESEIFRLTRQTLWGC